VSSHPHLRAVDRRIFLRGMGGALLALPILPSLFRSKTALAQATQANKCFVHFRTPHGGVSTANMWPGDAALTEKMTYTHELRRGVLAASTSGNSSVISPVLSASSTVLTPSILAKMNILRGLDIPVAMAHNFGAPLGYYDVDHGTPKQPTATIDQVLAYSPAFYPSLGSVKRRSVAISASGSSSGSYGYRTAGVRSSGVSTGAISGTESAQNLFDTLLAGTMSSPATQNPRTPVVDRVLDSYKRLRDGTKRLSPEDKLRLDQHINAVAELQRGLKAPLAAGCVVPARPTSDSLSLRPMDGAPAKNIQFFTMINQVLAVAMNCGATRVVTFQIDENNQALTFTSRAAQGEDWHNNVAHTAAKTAPGQDLIKQFNQAFFSSVYMDLVSRLDGLPDGMGGSALDRSLVAWGQECGQVTHWAFSMPVITAGSAGGAIKTGSYCDYRNLNRRWGGDSSVGNEGELLWTGLIYNQWLTTVLQAMGVPASEWAETTHPGYGARVSFPSDFFAYSPGKPQTSDVYTDAMWQKTADVLPFLK
jgi:Protein of unknown function (DUF1552)